MWNLSSSKCQQLSKKFKKEKYSEREREREAEIQGLQMAYGLGLQLENLGLTYYFRQRQQALIESDDKRRTQMQRSNGSGGVSTKQSSHSCVSDTCRNAWWPPLHILGAATCVGNKTKYICTCRSCSSSSAAQKGILGREHHGWLPECSQLSYALGTGMAVMKGALSYSLIAVSCS